MLSRLRVKNLALIDEISIEFEQGLNILTGETGTGKSIIIDAVNLILGERADKELIQTGKDFALVEGFFCFGTSEKLENLLNQFGIQSEEDGSLVIMRQLSQSGRNICKINGYAATLSMLKEVSRHLLDIHGQHQHQSLLSTEYHMELLDRFGGDGIIKCKQQTAILHKKWKAIRYEIGKLRTKDKDGVFLKDHLMYQINEISKACLKPAEQEELTQERVYLQNSGKIAEVLQGGYAMLYSGAQGQLPVHDQIAKIRNQLGQVAHLDKKFDQLSKDLDGIYYQLEDIITVLRDYKDAVYFEPGRLDEIENRLASIQSLKRKYGNTIEQILEFKISLEVQLSELEDREHKLHELMLQEKEHYENLLSACICLTSERNLVARSFREQLLEQLRELGMDKSDFRVAIHSASPSQGGNSSDFDALTEQGMDAVEFMISPNPGEPLKPLVKIVSGGEVSRIMLAFKVILARIDEIPVLIFDEVDVGISGRIAQVVAEKMNMISKYHQLICVTHLPQIASMADVHFVVRKDFIEARTVTTVNRLDAHYRQEEVAKMIGGGRLTRLSLDHAKELLDSAQNSKNK